MATAISKNTFFPEHCFSKSSELNLQFKKVSIKSEEGGRSCGVDGIKPIYFLYYFLFCSASFQEN